MMTIANNIKRLSKGDIQSLLQGLLKGGRQVIAPVIHNINKTLFIFRPIKNAEEVYLPSVNTQWSPKEYLFLRTEKLFSYEVKGDEVTMSDPPAPLAPQVLFGLRPCDAAGIKRLDKMLIPDPFYARRRELTTLVTFACLETKPSCFCTAVGGSPFGEEGSDLLLLAQGENYLMKSLTPKGADLVKTFADKMPQANDGEWNRALDSARLVEEKLKRKPIPKEWALPLEKSFDDKIWADLSKNCVGCSICAYVCPSCSCFDVQDEGNSWCGTRCRSWDACSFSQFTLHASGHNPRPTQESRYRQRVLHKFAYFPAQMQGEAMCVGCGRCIELCPVGVDIHQSVHAVMNKR